MVGVVGVLVVVLRLQAVQRWARAAPAINKPLAATLLDDDSGVRKAAMSVAAQVATTTTTMLPWWQRVLPLALLLWIRQRVVVQGQDLHLLEEEEAPPRLNPNDSGIGPGATIQSYFDNT